MAKKLVEILEHLRHPVPTGAFVEDEPIHNKLLGTTSNRSVFLKNSDLKALLGQACCTSQTCKPTSYNGNVFFHQFNLLAEGKILAIEITV
jgi:hypothetical protein